MAPGLRRIAGWLCYVAYITMCYHLANILIDKHHMSKTLFKSTSVVSGMTMVSRVLGFVRDMIAAQIFGASASVDAFYIAFKIPNFMRTLFAEGSFSQAFVPVLSEYRQKREIDDVKNFINHIAGALGSVLLLVTIIGVLLTPVVIMITAPGLDPLRFHYATDMLRVTFPYLMLISLTAFAGSILNAYGYFSVPAFTPALLNISLIAAALWLSPHFHVPVEAQAWGVLIAGVVQLCFQAPFLYRLGFFPTPKVSFKDPGVRRVLKLMLPAIFGASVNQISLLLNTVFASFLAVGSVTWLYYSDRLAYFPLGVFGVALATVVLPHLSRKHADQSPEHFRSALDWGLRLNVLIGLPASFVLLIFAGPIITTLFHYGKFNTHDVLMTRESCMAYAFGLLAFMLIKLLSSAFYARQDIKTPVKFAVITLVFNMIMNAVLIIPFKHAGLALATSLSAWLNVGLLYTGLYKRGVYRLQRGWGRYFMQLLTANAIIAVLLLYAGHDLNQWFQWHWPLRFMHLFFWMGLAILCYFVSLFGVGLRVREFRIAE